MSELDGVFLRGVAVCIEEGEPLSPLEETVARLRRIADALDRAPLEKRVEADLAKHAESYVEGHMSGDDWPIQGIMVALWLLCRKIESRERSALLGLTLQGLAGGLGAAIVKSSGRPPDDDEGPEGR